MNLTKISTFALEGKTNLNDIYNDIKKETGVEDAGKSIAKDVQSGAIWFLGIVGVVSIVWGIFNLVKHDKKGWVKICVGLLALVIGGILFATK